MGNGSFIARDALYAPNSRIQPSVARTRSDTPRLGTDQGRPEGQTSSLKTCMAGGSPTRASPSRKRRSQPPATGQRRLGESGCGLNRRWPGWKPIPRPKVGAFARTPDQEDAAIPCAQTPPSGDVAYTDRCHGAGAAAPYPFPFVKFVVPKPGPSEKADKSVRAPLACGCPSALIGDICGFPSVHLRNLRNLRTFWAWVSEWTRRQGNTPGSRPER